MAGARGSPRPRIEAVRRGPTLADPRLAAPARSRAFYLPPWRVDLTVRAGVPRLVSLADLARVAVRALMAAGAPQPASIGLILADDRELTELNARHMGVEGPTDVLSFPLLPAPAYPSHPGQAPAGGTPVRTSDAAAFLLPPGVRMHLGDVVVSVERAIDQAVGGHGGWEGDARGAPADELRLLVTHGVLHVCGWDHVSAVERAAMRRLEAELLGR